jgi:hypothetical protein
MIAEAQITIDVGQKGCENVGPIAHGVDTKMAIKQQDTKVRFGLACLSASGFHYIVRNSRPSQTAQRAITESILSQFHS